MATNSLQHHCGRRSTKRRPIPDEVNVVTREAHAVRKNETIRRPCMSHLQGLAVRQCLFPRPVRHGCEAGAEWVLLCGDSLPSEPLAWWRCMLQNLKPMFLTQAATETVTICFCIRWTFRNYVSRFSCAAVSAIIRWRGTGSCLM